MALTVMLCGPRIFASVRVKDEDACLGDIVRRDLRLCDHLVGIRHAEVDDAAPLAGNHVGRDQTAHIEDRMEIVGEHPLPALDGFIEQPHAPVRASAVDERIDAPELALHARDERFLLGRLRHVAARGERSRALAANRLADGLSLGGALAIAQRDRPAILRQAQADSAADAFSVARNDRHAVAHVSRSRGRHLFLNQRFLTRPA